MLRSASTLALAALVLCSCDSNTPKEEGRFISPLKPFLTVDTDPDWSPDGRSIAYTHGQEVWIIDLATRAKRPVTRGRDPDWSPDGQHIAYNCGADVCRIEVATGAVTQLTTWGSCFYPQWSPDGEKIAFDTNHGDAKGAAAIWVMDADGSNKRDISVHGTGEWREPSWTPDGRVLHHRYLTGIIGKDIFVMSAEGNEGRRLTSNNHPDEGAKMSPDGGRIVWSSDDGSGKLFLWTMKAEGSEAHSTGLRGAHPTWSPDGRRIAYYGRYAENAASLWIANSDGTNPQLLTRYEDYLTSRSNTPSRLQPVTP